MNRDYIFWDKSFKRFLSKTCGVLSDGSIAIFKEGHLSCILYEGEVTAYKSTGLMATNNKMVYADSSIVEFEFLEELHKPVTLRGVFTWSDSELRYEIDIDDSYAPYVCLSYDYVRMSKFKVIGTLQENPEMIKKVSQ